MLYGLIPGTFVPCAEAPSIHILKPKWVPISPGQANSMRISLLLAPECANEAVNEWNIFPNNTHILYFFRFHSNKVIVMK